MNSKFNSIFVCFVIQLTNVFIVNSTEFDSFSYYNDSEITKMTSEDRYHLHHAFVIEDNKWKDRQIRYKIDEHFTMAQKRKIFLAMNEIEKSSCIRFLDHDPISNNSSDYVMIEKDFVDPFAASSNLGCLHQGKQYLSLGSSIFRDRGVLATILHELLHTIGFDHHHQRSDRDKYIEIHSENTNLSDVDVRENYAKNIMFSQKVVRFWRYFVYQANGNFGVPIHSPPNQPQQPMPGKHPFFAPGQQWPPQQQQQPVQSVPAPPRPSPSAPASAKQPQQQQKQQQKQPTQSLAQKNYVLPSGQVSQRKRKISAPRDGYESSDCGCCEKKNSKKVKVLVDSTVWVVGDSDEENIDSCSDSCSSDD